MPDPLFELTSFQRDLLYVIAGDEKLSGQEIKTELQMSMDQITHGRLYPNLDTLVEREYVHKGKIDRRTNFYELTDKGIEGLRDRRE